MVIVAAMSAVAALMPAQRALRIHPIVVMRQE
jgi:ABC-type lipoprotein release transport system permease subunit